jgi:predicted nuclease with RNAse H fold
MCGADHGEGFPHAIVCSLSGSIVPAHPKKSVRCDVLRSRDLDISSLTNIDLVDAALCAVAADAFRRGEVKLYGDAKEGFVVVPRERKLKGKRDKLKIKVIDKRPARPGRGQTEW